MTNPRHMVSTGVGWSKRIVDLGGTKEEASLLEQRLKKGMAAEIDRDILLEALKSAKASLEQAVRLGRFPPNNQGLRDAKAALERVEPPEAA